MSDAAAGVLLLHIDGVVATQPVTPEVAMVVSWKADGCDAARL